MAEQMSTQKDLTDLKELVRSKSKIFEKASQGVKQALETVEINNQWKNNNYKELSRYLNRMNYKDLQNIEDDIIIWYLENFYNHLENFIVNDGFE